MKKLIVALFFFVCCFANKSHAMTMYEEVNFLNYDESLDGQAFDWNIQNSLNNWYTGPWGFSFVLPSGWNEAYLSLILGGAGRVTPPEIYLNNIYLGEASIGDAEALGLETNIYKLDTWMLPEEAISSLSIANLLDIKIGDTDGWTLEGINFAGFRVIDGGEPAAPVPEPATMLLLGGGFASMMSLRKKKKQC